MISKFVSRIQPEWQLVLLLLVSPLIGIGYLNSDLWFDEIVTLYDFALQDNLRAIFAHYPVANNHVWYSFLLWLWLRLTDFTQNEYILRLPGVLISSGFIAILYCQVNKLYSRSAAVLITLTFVVSPIYQSHCYQLRGYGLSLLLTVMATVGAVKLIHGQMRSGLRWYLPGAILLPGVIPTNILINLALLVAILMTFWRQGKLVVDNQKTILLLTAAAVGGMVIYLPVATEFLAVARGTHAWDSAGAIGWDVFKAFGIQNGAWILFTLVLAGITRKTPRLLTDEECRLRHGVQIILLISVLIIVLSALVLKPFPRNYLVFLVPLTWGILWWYRAGIIPSARVYQLIILGIMLNGAYWQFLTEHATLQKLSRGETPQNLSEQFYTRNREVSTMAWIMANELKLPNTARIFIDYQLFPSLKYYWQLVGGNPDQLECLNGAAQFPLKLPDDSYGEYPQYVIGYEIAKARQDYERLLGLSAVFEPIDIQGVKLKIFHITGIN